MKKILFILLFAPLFLSAQTEIPTQTYNGLYYSMKKAIGVDSVILMPVNDTSSVRRSLLRPGATVYRYTDSLFYFYTGKQWKRVGLTQSDLRYANIEWFGAKGDGVTNCNTAFEAAINTGLPVYVPQGVFLLSKRLNLKPAQRVFGDGKASQLRFTTDTSLFWCDSANLIENIYIKGNAVLSSYSSDKLLQNGIRITKSGTVINNVWLDTLGGAGIKVDNILTNRFQSVKISSCTGQGNNNGIFTDYMGEYVTISNSSFIGGNIGARIVAGNTSLIGGDYNANRLGIFLIGGGGNDGHCVASGVKINHNTDYSVFADGIEEGYTFSGCMLYYGGIYLRNSQLVTFEACDLNLTSNGLIQEGAKDCYIRNSKFRQLPTLYPNYSGAQSRVFLENNTYDDVTIGLTPSKGYFQYNLVGGFWRGGFKNDLTVSTGTTLDFDFDSTQFNGVSGNILNYTLDTFFNRTLKRFECRGYGNGQVIAKGQLTCNVPVAGDAAKVVCIISVNPASGGSPQAFRCQAYKYNLGTDTQISFSLSISLDVEPDDNITIYLINQSGQTVTVLSDPSVTFFSAQGF